MLILPKVYTIMPFSFGTGITNFKDFYGATCMIVYLLGVPYFMTL